MQVDINNDGTVDWDELSSFMIEMGMKGWAKSGVGMPNYACAGPMDSARPTHAANQVCLRGGGRGREKGRGRGYSFRLGAGKLGKCGPLGSGLSTGKSPV